jgi:Fe-S oxidoreductase
MNPAAMTLLLTSGFGFFAWSIGQRWQLLFAGDRRRPNVLGHWRRRWSRLLTDGLLQTRLRQYPVAGLAHSLMFFGFLILLLRTITLWGRGFSPGFELWTLWRDAPPERAIGAAYNAVKDVAAILVLLAAIYFGVQRVFVRPRRLTLSWEGLIILKLIGVMMIADAVYDGASALLALHWDDHCQLAVQTECVRMSPLVAGVARHLTRVAWRPFPDPLGSLAAVAMRSCSASVVIVLGYAGFWVHSVLVIVFLNWLPYSKHFHILTALPNVYLASPEPGGKLAKVASSAEELLEMADALQSSAEIRQPPLGLARVADLTWKHRLDLFSCTECGRCSEHCPAFGVGKPLSPKQLTLDLRRALYDSKSELIHGSRERGEMLVPRVVTPETLWSCTACRACEEQCPVGISYVDKIIDFRRDLVLMRGELPHELQRTFDGMEHSGNPWNLPRSDRAAWADGLGVRRISEIERTDVLYWVGCAASYDRRAQQVARSFVSLLQKAKVDFAILGEQESCTGDAARRAGNEYLFLQLAQRNIALLNSLYEAKRFRRIATACPHCLTTLKHEYPDFGGNWPIMHHQQLLLELLNQGSLQPSRPLDAQGVFHDPCTLARYAGDVVTPRSLLRKVKGMSLHEAQHHSRSTLCCGAGGARMWMDEAPDSRMNVARSKELLDTGAEKVVTACPFCATMISDGIASLGATERARVLDIAEVLAEACGTSQVDATQSAM